MNKAELVNAVAERCMLSRREAETAIDGALDIITECLVKGDEVKISGFGIFNRKDRASRIGTNPSSGEKIEIAASTSVSFKPSKNLKEKMN